jgi:ABC-type uncharacterized transport system involved in gliding motility auxiliary subunit
VPRIVDFLAPLGFVVMVVSQTLVRVGKPLPGNSDYYLVAGLLLMVIHLAIRARDIVSAVGARQVRHGSNTLVFTVTVLAILIGLNYLVSRHDKRWDLTKGKRYSLSDQSRKIASDLKEDIKITYFHHKIDMEQGRARLAVYEALSPHFKTEYVDPFANPTKAQEMEVRGPWPTIVFERGTRRERITSDSESDVTNALIKVMRDKKKKVCFEQGEGERDIDDPSEVGLSNLKSAITKGNYDVDKISLIRDNKVPEGCDVVIIAGPSKDLLPPEIDALRTWVKGGGKVLAMVEPERDGTFPNIDGLLKDWNIEAGKNIVLDISQAGQMLGTGPLTPVVLQYPYHDITRDFRVMTIFHTARTMKASVTGAEGVNAQNLIETSAQSWATTDLALKDPRPHAEDMKGPLPIAAVSVVHGAGSIEGRVVAFGDVDFASNQILSMQGNQDLTLNSVAWLSHDEEQISIRPVEPDTNRLFLTQGQSQLVNVISLVVLPGAFVVGGIAGWWRRRRG